MSNFSTFEKEMFISIVKKAEVVFLKPNPLYSYDDIVNGCIVSSPFSGISKTMYAVGNNTWRGFHRTSNSIYGSKEIFTSYFSRCKQKILSALNSITSMEELHTLEESICNDIRNELFGNIKENQLKSYNKIRKPVDLYIEHIISMCSEISSSRINYVKLLFLPLDSQIFSSPYIFSRSQLYSNGIKDNATFKDVKSRITYNSLQRILLNKAVNISNCIGREFHRIYFDLLWNDRYRKPGRNLFETNF